MSGLSIVTLYFYAKGYKTITNDRAQILEKMDKIIYYLAFAFTGLLTLIEVIYTAPFLAFTLRLIYLFLVIVICSVVACIYFPDEKYHALIGKVMRGAFGWSIILWFFSVMGKRDANENECHYFSIVLFSLTGLVISLVLCGFGYGSIKQIKETDLKEFQANPNGLETLSEARRGQESGERIDQLTILVAVNVVASFVQLLWDFKKYNANYSMNQCNKVTTAHTFFGFIPFLIMDVFCTLLPPWGIYYLYYWKNRLNFRSNAGDWERHLSDFDDIRSELI